MGPLDLLVSRSFGDQKGVRIVTFPVDGRYRAYFVRSQSEEFKIRAFLKMYYCAELSLQLVGVIVTIGWLVDLVGTSGGSAAYAKSLALFLGVYFVTVGVPYILLASTYKKALLSFVSAQDEAVVSAKNRVRQPRSLIVMLFGLAILTGVIFYLIGSK